VLVQPVNFDSALVNQDTVPIYQGQVRLSAVGDVFGGSVGT